MIKDTFVTYSINIPLIPLCAKTIILYLKLNIVMIYISVLLRCEQQLHLIINR